MSNCGHVRVLTAIWFMLSGSPHDIYAMYGPYTARFEKAEISLCKLLMTSDGRVQARLSQAHVFCAFET